MKYSAAYKAMIRIQFPNEPDLHKMADDNNPELQYKLREIFADKQRYIRITIMELEKMLILLDLGSRTE